MSAGGKRRSQLFIVCLGWSTLDAAPARSLVGAGGMANETEIYRQHGRAIGRPRKRLIGQDKEKQMKKFSDSIVLVALRCGTWLRDRLSCCAAEVLLVQTGI
ncbi:hypothetical protein M431DRAFT_493278 [Trichoderma harzianum CBS 226.95]|uniref:Secreted protein n=2 Tax=Trichoderma TaxID=5543 RepID=A0A2T4AIC4_TRIHA|nr:hypothetical protein M431DRAFT_493278 [Trichoderma harzianum CBS 226.95]PTB56803.1 hypothetical protein M431DRAFT_493278 [Trichoderma harzianum CBS 226.95]QYT01344.1 hypothetical protein H0G86_008388 [Trichoderma simmonsii]